MGMYDTISWGDDLPFSPEMEELGLNKNDWEFQTKDLECAMDHYVVQGKKLHLRKFKVEKWVEGDPEADLFTGMLGYLDRQDPYLEELKLTTTLRVYDFRYSVQDKWDCWVEYEVIVKDGLIDSVRLIEFKKESDFIRKESNRQLAEELAREKARLINRLFFHTRFYFVISVFLRRRLYSLSNLILRIANAL
jgi:hypothetical protein